MDESAEPLDQLSSAALPAAYAGSRVVEALGREVARGSGGNAAQAAAEWDKPTSRAERVAKVEASDAPADAKHARIVADKMNGTDPRAAAVSAPTAQPGVMNLSERLAAAKRSAGVSR